MPPCEEVDWILRKLSRWSGQLLLVLYEHIRSTTHYPFAKVPDTPAGTVPFTELPAENCPGGVAGNVRSGVCSANISMLLFVQPCAHATAPSRRDPSQPSRSLCLGSHTAVPSFPPTIN